MPSRLRKQKDARRATYIANSDKVRAQTSLRYYRNLEKERARAREYSQASYNALSRVKRAERKAQMLAVSKEAYAASPTKKRAHLRPLLRQRMPLRQQRSERRCELTPKKPMPPRL